ncbi:MAG: GNAT family N-acetyltransferase [Betaproteobacteria bacterium]|nr:GNAT family N-acetyltransferase [Betaproteobacteria bacterium]
MSEVPIVELLDWTRARALAQPMRTAVFVLEQGVPAELEWDEWDERSVHALARQGGTPAGNGRLLPADEEGTVRIGRMAVLGPFRVRGVGAAILRALLARARETGARQALLHAQASAAGFYRRHGFTERGGEFVEAGIPHVEMVLSLHGSSGD